MAGITNRRQLEIFEVHTDDGGVGLQFGDGQLFKGYDENDLMRLLEQVFEGIWTAPPFIDAELYNLANTYLDEDAARKRWEELGEL